MISAIAMTVRASNPPMSIAIHSPTIATMSAPIANRLAVRLHIARTVLAPALARDMLSVKFDPGDSSMGARRGAFAQ